MLLRLLGHGHYAKAGRNVYVHKNTNVHVYVNIEYFVNITISARTEMSQRAGNHGTLCFVA